ncbi:hypothetical protein [Lysobacter enzymogenes]|uniref:hypothetical protein n=1 Tax=Lysobacter enzymogenes TaxID=69 RepID=UPI00099CD404|nr:hypothetical protein [Lysobacter enzymogenes]UZW61258.1 hypothetical protein BV903_002885 [Lysobacter enzymogenes]
MDENLHYLLHQELDGLFDPPSAGAGTGDSAPSPAASATQAEPSSEPTRAERLRDPKLLQALVRLLGLHA